MRVNEASPDTFEGSLSDDQLISRLWMARRLNDTGIPVKNCIVLGSWYGLVPYILRKINRIPTIVAIDENQKYIDASKKLNPHIKHFCKDVNDMHYHGADCIVNPSINNITGTKWYGNIPMGKLCLFQTEDIEVEEDCPSNLEELKTKFPLTKYLYEGTLSCKDKDGPYTRSMIIGIK